MRELNCALAPRTNGLGLRAVVFSGAAEIRDILSQWRRFRQRRPRGACFEGDLEYLLISLERQPARTPYVVIIYEGDDICCVAPFVLGSTPISIRLSVFRLWRTSARVLTCPGSAILCDESVDQEACRRLVLEAICDCGCRFDLISFPGVGLTGQLLSFFHANAREFNLQVALPSWNTDLRYHIEVVNGFDAYLAALGSKTRATLRRRVRKLMSSGGEIEKVTSPDRVETLLKDIDAIYGDTWQAKTYGDRKRCTRDEIAKFQRLAEVGWLRSYVLRYRDEPIAFQVGYQYEDSFSATDFAFARIHSRLGPGSALMYLFLQDIFDEKRLKWVDLGQGDSPQKKTFRGQPTEVRDVYLVRARRWRALVRLQNWLDRLESAVRVTLDRFGVDEFVRRILKRKG